jgi:hypothetical protein
MIDLEVTSHVDQVELTADHLELSPMTYITNSQDTVQNPQECAQFECSPQPDFRLPV